VKKVVRAQTRLENYYLLSRKERQDRLQNVLHKELELNLL